VATASGTPTPPGGDDPVAARRIRRAAWLLGVIAVAVYAGFIIATALRS
jgi:hypothetical protein